MKKLLLAIGLFISLHVTAQNSSIVFDGATQYVNVPDNNSIDLSANFTIEVWIHPTGPGSNATQGGIIVNKEDSYEIARFTDGTIQYALSANGLGNDWAWINTGIVAPLNTWSHITMVKSGVNITFYLNGVSAFTNATAPATLAANTTSLRFASRTNSVHNFAGRMDELRIWNTARTAAQIKANIFNKNLLNATAGLVGYYRMNEGSGVATANSSTNTSGINGTLIGTPTWLASPVQFSANAMSFDGGNDIISIPDDNTLDLASTMTIEAWVYATTGTAIQNVVSKSSQSQNNGYIFPRTDDNWANVAGYLFVGGSFRTVTAPYPSLNAWHHLAITYDGTTMRIYVNGVLSGSYAPPTAGAINNNTNPLVIGNQTGYTEFFSGNADEIRIWNVTRTQAQIQANMNKEIDPSTAGLVSYYTLNQGIAAGNNTGLTTIMDLKGNNNGTASGFTLSGTSTNYILQKTNLTILPVTWLGFVAQKQNDKVSLSWSTANEQNSENYIVQHSSNGNTWTNIGNIAAALNSNTIQQYSLLHNNPVKGVNYYRIAQQDADGRTSYSKIVTLLFETQLKKLIVYPNPVTDGQLNIQVEEEGMVSIFNSAGVLVWNKRLPAGAQPIDVSKLNKGVYQLKAGKETVQIAVQ